VIKKLSANPARRRQCERNFLDGRGPKYSGVATVHNLYITIGDLDICIEFELLEVKVPIVFLGTEGFSLRRDRR
jgi:hypothetical protein